MTIEKDSGKKLKGSKLRRNSLVFLAVTLVAGLTVWIALPAPLQSVLAVTPSGLELSAPVGVYRRVEIRGKRLQITTGGGWSMKMPPGIEILLEGEIVVSGQKWSTGARLTVDENHDLVQQSFARRMWNTTKLYVWKLKNPGEADPETAFIRAETVGLRSSPDTGPTDRQDLSFGTEVEIVFESDDGWLYVREPVLMARGWLHRAVTAGSPDEISRLQRDEQIPGLILLIDVQEEGRLETMTLAGGMVISKESLERGGPQLELQPRDCVLFEESGLHLLSQPLQMLGQTISDPLAGEFYCLNESGVLEKLDLAAVDNKS